MSINNRNPRAAPVRNIGETGSGSNSREVPDWGCPMRTDLDEVAWDPRVSGVAGERRAVSRDQSAAWRRGAPRPNAAA